MAYTRFEEARILGARALQLAMGAPPLIKPTGKESPLEVASRELDTGKMPLTVIEK